MGFVGGCSFLGWALASVFPPALAISVTRPQALGVDGSRLCGGLATAARGCFQGWYCRGHVACGEGWGVGGGSGVLQRVREGLIPYSRVLALLGTQMVVVNSSSPVAACSGPWDTRGMEESVTTSSGNAESLYMQGTGQEAGLGHPLPSAHPTTAAEAG